MTTTVDMICGLINIAGAHILSIQQQCIEVFVFSRYIENTRGTITL